MRTRIQSSVFSLQQLAEHPDKPLVATMSDAGQMSQQVKAKLQRTDNTKLNHEGLEDAVIPLFKSPSGLSLVNMDKVRSFGDLSDLIEPEVTVHLTEVSTDVTDSNNSDTDSHSPSSDIDSSAKGRESSDPSLFDTVLLEHWDVRQREGLFRYDVSSCETKVVNGRYGFVAQLNEGRALQKRPTEFSVDEVVQPFDDSKFNFKKASQDEVIFQFGTNADDDTSFKPEMPVQDETNMVLINVSPIEYGHVLLVPRILDNLPQQIRQPELLLALQMAKSSDNPYVRVGYNSLGAYATINHLHFQAYYMKAPFPVERAPTKRLSAKQVGKTSGVHVYTVEDFPCRGLVFEGKNRLHDLADVVGGVCRRLEQKNIPFNLLIVDCGSRVFLFPQRFAEQKTQNAVADDILDTQVNPACFEICGHMVLKRQEDFDNVNEGFIWRMLAAASLDEEKFDEVIKLIRD